MDKEGTKGRLKKKGVGDRLAQIKRLYAEKCREVEMLHRITESISSTLDLESILKEIVGMVIEVTKADACLLYLLDDDAKELVLRASKNPHPKLIGRIKLELGEGVTGWVAKEGRTVAIPRNAWDDPRFKVFHNLPEDRYQAFISAPVIHKRKVVGVINVQHKRPRKFSDGEIAILTTIGHQVGGAIANARFYEQMKKNAQQIQTLSQVSRTITSDRYLEEILNLIVTMTASMMNSKICSIMLLDEGLDELRIVATQSLSSDYRSKAHLKVGESVSGRVVKEGHPINVMNVTQEPLYKYQDLARQEGLCSLLSVPMMIKDRVIGVVNLYTAVEHRFGEEETHLLQAVANQAAIAIENTQLVQKTSDMEEALETRKQVERAKGILMRQTNISEEEAFRLLQKQSMNARRTMREIAEAVILTAQIKRPLAS